MRHVAAYLLAVMGGKTVDESSIKDILGSVGVEADDKQLGILMKKFAGKDIDELIAAGGALLSSMPSGGMSGGGGGGGGGGGAASAAGAGGAAAAAEVKEEKIEEPEEESDDDMGFGLFD